MLDALIAGSEVIIHVGPPHYPVRHAMLISGVRTDYGKITFHLNDPAYGVEPLDLDQLSKYVIHLGMTVHNTVRNFIADTRGPLTYDEEEL